MAIWAIADPHLSFVKPYEENCINEEHHPMSIFGERWQEHCHKLYNNCRSQLKSGDTLLVCGDISWAMTLEEAKYDFDYLASLADRVIIIKGNHDYFWQSYSKVQAHLPENIFAVQNNALIIENSIICGTRGWLCPSGAEFSSSDEKIYKRELLRLEMSLKEGRAIKEANNIKGEIIVMTHFRPTNDDIDDNEFLDLMEQYQVSTCLYGHLHGGKMAKTIPSRYRNINFQLVSGDYLDFSPLLIQEDK